MGTGSVPPVYGPTPTAGLGANRCTGHHSNGPRAGCVASEDAIALVAGVLVVGLGMIAVRNGSVSGLEKAVFHAVNDLPGALYPVLWPFQQLGAILVGPIVALVAAVTRRYRLALAVLAATVAKLVTERVVKAIVSRQRPGTSVGADIHLRGNVSASGESFVSGHAVLVAALATLVAPYLPRPLEDRPVGDRGLRHGHPRLRRSAQPTRRDLRGRTRRRDRCRAQPVLRRARSTSGFGAAIGVTLAPTGATGSPSPPRRNAQRDSVPQSSPTPTPPITSRGRCAPAYTRAKPTSPASTAARDTPTPGQRRDEHRRQGERHRRVAGHVAQTTDVLAEVDAGEQRRRAAADDDALDAFGRPEGDLAGDEGGQRQATVATDDSRQRHHHERADEAADLHRAAHDRPERVREVVDPLEDPLLPRRHVPRDRRRRPNCRRGARPRR